ncbi:hypothetical protein MSG28_014940 [Choristoneura fumiferana]|uniref:Uncharacterized protein n=1 Tax=Choristoneura fumiferana TaxID=7141 RepID=A0ACC0KXP1_CHOFU|nr:hypothetical protein MSG28_014940 [Choristoneura fumiferana]
MYDIGRLRGSESVIECTPEVMKVTVPMDGDRQISYLDQLKAGGRETHTVRCVVSGVKRLARAVDFPLDLIEPDVINITRNEQGQAPIPILTAVVKQNGRHCSVDPYLFDNFVTEDGDVLAAKFRAFKFPDTSYVQFKGTVTVCLDKCQGVQCSNGVTGYGRRRRSIDSNPDFNKVYEVSLTTFIKVDWVDGEKQAEDVLALLKNLKVANQMLGGADEDPESAQSDFIVYPEQTQREFILNPEDVNAANTLQYSCILTLSLLLALLK